MQKRRTYRKRLPVQAPLAVGGFWRRLKIYEVLWYVWDSNDGGNIEAGLVCVATL
jgi:hypothetical protein